MERWPHRLLPRPLARALRGGAWAALVLAACATPAPEPAPPLPAPVVVAPPQVCPGCAEQAREVARLQQELAARDAELRDLKAAQREQAKSAQETTREVAREVTRAKAKARRLATQADAASYLAEVEVAVSALRSTQAAGSPLPALATAYLEAAAEPFARGEYGSAMDRAAQAEEVTAVAADAKASPRDRASAERVLQVALPLRAATESPLRQQPRGNARPAGVVKRDAALTAHAWKDGWLRVETADGRSGWVDAARVAVR